MDEGRIAGRQKEKAGRRKERGKMKGKKERSKQGRKEGRKGKSWKEKKNRTTGMNEGRK